MNDVLRELHRKMDEIIGRQERSLSVLTAIQVGRGWLHGVKIMAVEAIAQRERTEPQL